MNRLPWFKFYPSDWIKGTRELSSDEKAAWIDLLSYMWESDDRGTITSTWEGIARMIGCEWSKCFTIIKGMEAKKVLDVTEINGNVTLVSRRIKTQELLRESTLLRVREYRLRKCNANVTREKSEVRSQKTDKDIKNTRFEKPTAAHVSGYAKEIGFRLDGQKFIDYYESKGWKIGNSPMKDWKAAVRTWKSRTAEDAKPAPTWAPPKPKLAPTAEILSGQQEAVGLWNGLAKSIKEKKP